MGEWHPSLIKKVPLVIASHRWFRVIETVLAFPKFLKMIHVSIHVLFRVIEAKESSEIFTNQTLILRKPINDVIEPIKLEPYSSHLGQYGFLSFFPKLTIHNR